MMKKNKAAFSLLLVSVILVIVLLSAPLFTFTSTLYTKKSANTFPDDEKYAEAKAETEDVLAEYKAQGIDAVVEEQQTLRETSKGTTSLMVFTICCTRKVSGFKIISSGLIPGNVLKAFVACLVLSLALVSVSLSMKNGTKAVRVLRVTAVTLSGAALLLVPVFAMSGTYCFHRAVKLWTEGLDQIHVEESLTAWNKMLFDGSMGDVGVFMKKMSAQLNPIWWLALPLMLLLFAMQMKICCRNVLQGLARVALYAVVIVMCVLVLYPFFVMFISAFRTPSETMDMKFLNIFPTEWIWSNLKDIIDRDVLIFMKNSVMLSCGATLLAMLCGIPAAYALSRMDFKGKKPFLGFIIMSQMFSPVVLLVGISKLMNLLNLGNSILGLALINAAFNQAFAIWFLRGTFSSISSEMEQAACIDGCGTVGALIHVLLPVAAPGIVTALIFTFINAWNEYTISTVLITNRLNKPITVGITEFSSFNMVEWQYLFAAALLATVPVVILFILIEKHLVSGLADGGVKG